MKLVRLLVAVTSAVAVLLVLASSASAGRISASEQRLRATFTRMDFSGALGTIECEAVIDITLHSRVITKTAGSLIGYVTAGNVNRCSRGGATVLRETLPWHIQYTSFSGTLPNISTIRVGILGFALRVREPTFGITCLFFSGAAQPVIMDLSGSGTGALLSGTFGGQIDTSCGVRGTVGGTSSSLTNGGGTRITVTLI